MTYENDTIGVTREHEKFSSAKISHHTLYNYVSQVPQGLVDYYYLLLTLSMFSSTVHHGSSEVSLIYQGALASGDWGGPLLHCFPAGGEM